MLKTDNTMEELLSLKWNNHRSTFLHILAVLRDKQLYTDATLACDGKLYSVHKLVLSTCSDYFSSMLDRTSCKSPVIVLKDIKCEDLEALLDYMYLGEVNVRQSDLATLIKAAECLRVKGLAVPDDEPPPRKARENQTRRGDTSGSPPAKRKRRSDVDDGRDDVRPPRQEVRQSSPVHSSSSVRPKSPVINSHSSPSPIRSNSTSNINSSNNPSNSNTLAGVSSNNSVTPRQVKDGTGDEYMESAPYVKVEMDDETGDGGNTGDGGGGGGDSSTGDIGDAYNLSNDDFKEEDDPDGSDMNADLPEFLQQATANYPHTSFAGPSFQPDLSWQGGSNGGEGGSGGAAGLAGSFAAAAAAGLSFGGSSQQDAAGHNTSAGKNGWSKEKSHSSTACDHSTEIVYCPICAKGFKGLYGKYNIKKHMIIHSGTKLFNCKFCSHTTNKKGNLKTHVISVHNKPFDDLQSNLHHDTLPSSGSIASWPVPQEHHHLSKLIYPEEHQTSSTNAGAPYHRDSHEMMDTHSLTNLSSSDPHLSVADPGVAISSSSTPTALCPSSEGAEGSATGVNYKETIALQLRHSTKQEACLQSTSVVPEDLSYASLDD